MKRPPLEVADVFRRHGEAYRRRCGDTLTGMQRRVMSAIEKCRTAALGGQIAQCDRCGHRRHFYRTCRNRHCPKRQGPARAAWLAERRGELLDCPYFHVVFTLPAEIAADPRHLGTEIGFLAVLHT